MENRENVVILIPSLNPDEKLALLVEKLNLEGYKDIIIVNDGSSEEYNEIFNQIKKYCVILKHSVNLGKGRALKTGFNYYLNEFKDKVGVITVDSDGQHKIEDINKMAEKLVQSPEALILGSRNFAGNKNVPARSKFGNLLTIKVFAFLTGVKVHDTQTGLRAIPTNYIKELMVTPGERFEYEMNMLMECKENEINVEEIPIETVYIEENKSSHFNPFMDSIRIYAIFFKYIISSIISFVVDIGLFKILTNILTVNYGDNSIIIATIGARIVSSFINYIINKNRVFKACDRKSLIKYYILCIVQMAISSFAVWGLYRLIRNGEVIIKIVIDTILFLFNFKIQREWVFKKEK